MRSLPISVEANAVARYEGSSPRHQAKAQLRVTLPRAAELDLSYRFVSALTARHAPEYHAVDVRLGWVPRPGLQLAVNGRNLTEARHVEFAHAPPPSVAIPRSVYASLTWTRGRERRR